ncbi:PEP-CTERM sorting domain-containing protein [Alteromonas ponticola]|uniref:PEP-CTERM sorting domain-containing protein n=1 Tax=Alteromonas aquimaris TaxID=2998417 RepID=A0ABT3PAZ7_9ALTE|nr:THxN family PEP-CTERM protein [Alteromonas aquimaris]MCW8109923.1 PEP-CTERM sorting domain-containing protein [Alteromonas aquimaris]
MKKLNIIAVATALTASTSAFADPMVIEQWSFINEAGFSSFTATKRPSNAVNHPTLSGDSANGGTSILVGGSLPDNLCWGDPAGGSGGQQSCLTINSPVSNNTTQSWDENGVMQDLNGGAPQGNAMTVGKGLDYTSAFKQGTALRHDNFPITGQFLDTVTITDGLQLTAVTPSGTVVNAPQLSFMVDFWETPNAGLDADGTCPFGPAAFTANSVNARGCSDLFEIIGFNNDMGGSLNIIAQGPDYIDFSVKFKVAGVDASMYHRDYELITRLSGLDVAFDDGRGFATRENGVNILNAQFAIRAVDAPEPSTLAVFAASLLGLAGFSRRKMKK